MARKHWKLFTGRKPAQLVILLLIGMVGGAAVTWYSLHALPKRFDVVKDGEIYRCGDVTPRSLKLVRDEHHIKTVLSLLNPDEPEVVVEREAAERLGLTWINVPLRGDGSSEPADRDRIREVMLDESNRPLLVHCSAGVNRTGLAVGMYHINAEGWTYEQVLQDLLNHDFDNLDKHENMRAALQEEAVRATSQPTADDGESGAG